MKKAKRIEVHIERERILVERRFTAAGSALCMQCRRVVPALPLAAVSVEAGFVPGEVEGWLAAGTVHFVAPSASLLCAESLLVALAAKSEH